MQSAELSSSPARPAEIGHHQPPSHRSSHGSRHSADEQYASRLAQQEARRAGMY